MSGESPEELPGPSVGIWEVLMVVQTEVGEACQELIMVAARAMRQGPCTRQSSGAPHPHPFQKTHICDFKKSISVFMMGKEAELCWTFLP